MKTTSKDKIEKAKKLLSLVETRKAIEKEEKELKAYFKAEATGGILEADNVIVMVTIKTRTSLNREKLAELLGDKIEEYETVTQYEQVDVKEVA